MRKVPIKFRGESAIGTVYGYFVKRDGKAYIANDVGSMVTVDEESIRQLVGYDMDGNEIYEGDKLFDEEHNTYVTAELYPCVRYPFLQKG